MTDHSFTRYQKIIILILAITQFTVILDFMIMAPLGDLMMKKLNLKPAEFALAVSAYAFSAGASGLLAAGFADRFDRKKLLLFFYCGFILGTVFCGLAQSYTALLGARIFTGLFGGVIGSISMAIITDVFMLQQRGRVMGFVQMGLGASQVLGIPISIFIASKFGWYAPFWMVAGIGIIALIGIVYVMNPIIAHLNLKRTYTVTSHLWHTVSQKSYRICYTATAMIAVTGFMLAPFSSSFAINNLGLTYDNLTIIMMASGISSLFIMPIIGKFSDRIDKLKIFSIAILVTMVTCVIYTNLSAASFSIILLLNILLSGGMLSRMIPASALTSAVPLNEDRGAFMSINASIQQMAGGVGAVLSGMLVTQKSPSSPLVHYGSLGVIVAIFSAIAWLMIYRVNKIVVKGQD